MIALQTWNLRHHLHVYPASEYPSLLTRVLADGNGFTHLEVSLRGRMKLGAFLDCMRCVGLQCSGMHLPLLLDLSESQVGLALNAVRRLTNLQLSVFCPNPLFTFMGHPNMDANAYTRLADNMARAREFVTRVLPNACFGYHFYDFDLSKVFGRHSQDLRPILAPRAIESFPPVLDSYFFATMGLDDRLAENKFGTSPISFHLNNFKRTTAQSTHHEEARSKIEQPLLDDANGRVDASAWIHYGLRCRDLHSFVIEHTFSKQDDAVAQSVRSLKFVDSYLKNQFPSV
jgi:hypothetical protein